MVIELKPATEGETNSGRPEVNTQEFSFFLIGKYIVGSHSPTGRATKGFYAFNLKTARLCFLKDYWRPNTPRIHAELDVYKRLHANSVRNIATVIAGGDVCDPELQHTIAQIFMTVPPDESAPVERAHCRLVIQELGRPLETYSLSGDMIGVVFDALNGARSPGPLLDHNPYCSHRPCGRLGSRQDSP